MLGMKLNLHNVCLLLLCMNSVLLQPISACYVVSLFWDIKFPFHARSFETAHRIKYIHITMVTVGLVLPTLPVIVAFSAGNPSTRGFRLTRFLCTSLQRDPTFYSLVLPINIVLAIGVPLLTILFWIIHKAHTFILCVQL